MRQKKDDAEPTISISQLVSVLDPGVVDPGGIVLACLGRLADKRGKARWRVYPPGVGVGFVPRVFLLAQLAYRKLLEDYHPLVTERAHASEPQLLVDTQDPDYSFLIGYLANIRSYRKKKKRYPNLPEELRECIPSRKMFWAQGRPKARWLRHAAALAGESFAFITLGDFTALTGLKTIPEEPQGTDVDVHQEVIQSNAALDAQTLAALADRLLRRDTRRTYSWQELYLKTLVARLELPKILIPVRAVERKLPEEHPPEQSEGVPSYPRPLDLHKALRQRRVVLLTGRGGSGKTTALKSLAQELAARWVRQRRRSGSKRKTGVSQGWFPILIRLDAVEVTEDTNFPGLAAQNVLSVLSQCSIEELARCQPAAELSATPSMTREQMLDRLRDHVAASFKGTAAGQQQNLFLLDRLDNVGLQARDYLADRLREWASDTDVRPSFVLAARGWDWAALQDALHLELAPLRDDHIQAFLQENLAGDRADLAWTHIARSPLTLDMARDAFFLGSMVRAWKQVGEFQPFANPTSVIGTIVREAAVRKVAEKAISDRIDPSSRNHVLSVLGYRQVEALTFGHLEAMAVSADDRRLAVPRDLEDLQASGYPVADILRQAEVLGILSDSGLRGHGSFPTFAHDLLRDYFAAGYLRQLRPDTLVSAVNNCLEFLDWDEPILMLVELLEDAGVTSQVILLALSVDAALGCECAARAPHLPGTTMSDLLQRMARHGEAVARLVHGRRSPGEGGFSLGAALSRLDKGALERLYASAAVPGFLRAAVPAALVFKGSDPVLALGTPSPGDRAENCFNMLEALSLLGTPEAFDSALSLFRNTLVEIQHDKESVMLGFHLGAVFWWWKVPGSLNSLLDILEKDQQEPILDAVALALPRASGISARALRRLSRLLDHPDAAVVACALGAIGQMSEEKAIKTLNAYIRKLLPFPRATVSDPPLGTALEALARISPHAAESLLRELLVRPDVFLSKGDTFKCIRLLGEVCLPESFETLLALLVSRDCEALYRALARFQHDPGARKRLEDLMHSHPLPHVQDKAGIVLGFMGQKSVAGRLLEILQRPAPPESDEEKPRWDVIREVEYEAKHPPSVKEHWSKCHHAAAAIGLLGQHQVTPTLVSLVRNEQVPQDIREECLKSLGRLGHVPSFQLSLDFMREREFSSASRTALIELGASVSLEQCTAIVQELKREWEGTQDQNKRRYGTYAWNLWDTGAEICERRRRRFKSSLGGWPLGLPAVGEEPFPPWLREVVAEL